MKTISQSNFGFLLWALRLRRRVHVVGASMFPALNEGDILLYNPRAYRHVQPQIDDIVVAEDPRNGRKIIKRVRDVREDGRVDLRGDNPAESTDSRHFGAVELSLIHGRVTSYF